jgi:hypothetical protein
MSGGRTLAPETWRREDLIAAGWRKEDLEWEHASEAAMRNLAGGDILGARFEIARALRIAVASFSDDDPRLGMSLANQGAALTSAGEGHLAGRAVTDALGVWRKADGWIVRMTAPRVARSSLFHMRMEQRHRATYEERWRVKWAKIALEARGQIEGAEGLFLISREEAGGRLGQWSNERPAMLNDTRKLTAAVILLAARRAG